MPAVRVLTPETAPSRSEKALSTGRKMNPSEAGVVAKGKGGSERDAEGLRRGNGMLHVIETDIMKNVTRVGPEAGKEGTEVRSAKFGGGETRLDVGVGKGKWDKPGRNGTGGVRKLWKGGLRRWKELRKRLGLTQRQMVMLVLFVVCLIVIALLMWGDDDESAAGATGAVKPVMLEEDVHLPSVRVNPALVAEAARHAANFADDSDH